MGKTIVIYVKFVYDVVCQRSLKSANVHRFIQIITLAPFFETYDVEQHQISTTLTILHKMNRRIYLSSISMIFIY